MKLRSLLYFFLYRKKLKLALGDTSRSPEEVWPILERVFSSARAVYSGPTGASARFTFEAELLELLLQHPSGEYLLSNNLENKSALVSAYCLAGLHRLNKCSISSLPSGLFERAEVVLWFPGGIGQRAPLGELARQVATH